MTQTSSIAFTLGKAIRKARQDRGMSMRELAEKVGITIGFLLDLEHDRRFTEQLPEIAAALNLPLWALATLDGHVESNLHEWLKRNPKYTQLLRDIRDGDVDGEAVLRAARKKRA